METGFSLTQLADPQTREIEKILRTCVHCGLCTATCPTYLLLGNELDSPRGRIYLIKQFIEKDEAPKREVVQHIDRCLSCLSCMTTCPSGVDYMHLVDHARSLIETGHRRSAYDRALRAVLAFVLPSPARFRIAVTAARWLEAIMSSGAMRPLAGYLNRAVAGRQIRAMLALSAYRPPSQAGPDARRKAVIAKSGRQRVILMGGCAQTVLAPSINQSVRRLLERHGVEVIDARGENCCGAIVHHLGREAMALDRARRNIDAWLAWDEAQGLAAIVVSASGCGTMVKDYGHMLRHDAAYAEKAMRVSALARDFAEFAAHLELKFVALGEEVVVAYHSACSMQHGQRITQEPKQLLDAAGFSVRDIPEAHICCGSAGTYNILQPDLADALRQRKLENVRKVKPDVIVTGNIGCMVQMGLGCEVPVLHTAMLLDWATGGCRPDALTGGHGAGAGERDACGSSGSSFRDRTPAAKTSPAP